VIPSRKSRGSTTSEWFNFISNNSNPTNCNFPHFCNFNFPDSNEISPDQDPKYQVLQDGTLMIENATDSDMGSYECMAKSPAGEVKSRSVHMKPITAASTSSTSVHNPAKGEILYNR
jgi:hypothetical protein